MECNKLKYKDKPSAEKQAAYYNKKRNGKRNLVAYKCDICGAWHLGGIKSGVRKKPVKYMRRG